jgi:hypothetical protein
VHRARAGRGNNPAHQEAFGSGAPILAFRAHPLLHEHRKGENPWACPGRTHGYKSDVHKLVRWMAYGSGQGCRRHNQLRQVNRHAYLLGADTQSHTGNREDPGRGRLQADRLLHQQVGICGEGHRFFPWSRAATSPWWDWITLTAAASPLQVRRRGNQESPLSAPH